MTTPGNDSADRPSRELPDRPNLRHLKDEAKSRVKSGEFAKLSDAQFAIAREFGFASWQKLHHHVEDMALRNLADDAFERDDLVAFFAAVRNDRPALVARILEAHPEFVNARIDPAHWSLKGESFARAITDGRSADPDGTSTQTALHHVAMRGWVNTAHALLEHGADVNAVGMAPNMGRCTPIVVAAWEGGIEVLRLLLTAGADATGEFGKAAAQTAASHRKIDRLDLLIEYGAPVDLSISIQAGLVERVVRQIDEDPSLLNNPDERGLIPLQAAVEVLHTRSPGLSPAEKMIDAFVSRGASVDVFSAAGMGDMPVLRKLLQDGPTLADAKLLDGRTPIFFAAMNDQPEAISLLLGTGADPNVHVDQNVKTPLAIAARRDFTEVCRRLLAGGAEPTDEAMRQGAWRNRDTECVRVLLDHGADVDSWGWGTVALHWPCMNGNLATAKLLIERGADVNAVADDWAAGATPLHFAAAGGFDAIVRALLEGGADPRCLDKNGRSPRDRAIQFGHESTAELLQQYKPDE